VFGIHEFVNIQTVWIAEGEGAEGAEGAAKGRRTATRTAAAVE
jgi:hypothetical protein